MSEYAEDKLRSLEVLQCPIFVVTALDSLPIPRQSFTYYRVPSISFYELSAQVRFLRAKKLSVPWQAYLMYPIAGTFGRVFDVILKRKFQSSMGGFWGWALASIPVTIYLRVRHHTKKLFCTGSASAGLVGAVSASIANIHFYYEVPDPIVSVTMEYSPEGFRRIRMLEYFLIRKSRLTTFVTHYAAELAKGRCPSLAEKIQYVYPGSWDFSPRKKHGESETLAIAHIGSLYGTRNLDALMQSLKNLMCTPEFGNLDVKITNIGGIDGQTYSNPHKRITFESIPEMDRESALSFAANASILLLIQHADERSKETIPYKVYDYLNLQIPVIGIIDNPEISALLRSPSFYEAPVGDVEALTKSLSLCISSIRKKEVVSFEKLGTQKQFPQIFGLKYGWDLPG